MQEFEELQNAAETYERPAFSYKDGGKYAGFEPFFAGNQMAPQRGADWNWLALYFSTTQSQISAGAQITNTKFTSATVFNLYLPNLVVGSVLFAGSGGLVSQNNASFFWDNTNKILKVDNLFVKSGNPWYDVKAYGAKGDGVTDDTTAIQAALTAAGVTGGTVYFPATVGNSYITSSTLNVPSAVYLRGPGKNSVLVNYTGTGTAFAPSGTGNNTGGISDLSIELTGNNAIGIDMSRWIRGSFSSLRVISGGGAGQIGISANITNVAWNSYYNEFVDLTCDGLATGIKVDSSVAQRANRWRLIGPTFLGCGTSMLITNVQGMQIVHPYSDQHTVTALNLGANADRVQVIGLTDESSQGGAQTFTVNAAANRCQLLGFSSYSATLGLASWNAFGTNPTVVSDAILGIGGQFANFGAVTDAAAQGDFAAGLAAGGKILFTQATPLFKYYSSNSRFDVYIDTPNGNAGAINWQNAGATKFQLYRPAATNDLQLDSNAHAGIMYFSNGGGVTIANATGFVGFFGTAVAVQQTSGANLTNNVTAGGVNDTIANFTDLTTYANDAAAIRNDIYQLARKLKQVNDSLRTYGLLT